jgi:hypothetical protein
VFFPKAAKKNFQNKWILCIDAYLVQSQVFRIAREAGVTFMGTLDINSLLKEMQQRTMGKAPYLFPMKQ